MRLTKGCLTARLLPGLLGLLGLLALGCGGGGGDDGPDAAPPTTPHLAFDLPANGPIPLAGFPYPSDVLRDPVTGAIDVTAETLAFAPNADATAVANMVASLRAHHGFGVSTGALFPVAGLDAGDAVDDATITAETAMLVELGAGTTLPIAHHVRAYGGQIYLAPANGIVLAQGGTYAYLLRSGIKTKAGRALAPDPDLVDLLTSASPQGALARAAQPFVPLGLYLTREQIDPTTVVGATVFTTERHAPVMTAARSED